MAQRLDHALAAISDPTRRAILDRLTRGPARVTEVAEPFEMSLAAVSKHVRALERAGLVRRVRRGREHTLTLDARPLRRVAQWMSRYERFWDERRSVTRLAVAGARTSGKWERRRAPSAS
jgi:DNA-binding transcriptional ArsR family regulator